MKREWLVKLTIQGPDGESVTATFAYDSVDKLLNYPETTNYPAIIRSNTKLLLESTQPTSGYSHWRNTPEAG